MPRVKAAAAAVVAVCALLAGCAGTTASQGGPDSGDERFIAGDGTAQVIAPAARKTVANVAGTTLDGEPLALADLRGKVVVMNFWASWCAPCRGEAPTLQKLSQEHKSKGVEFVGVNFKDAKDQALAMERSFGITYPSLFDGDGRLMLAFRDIPPNAVPSTLIFDRQGRVAVRVIGATTYSKLNPLINRVVAEG
ncbi:TlpA disulfide reductase family protein [Thermomonospora sp. CIF 1]|jgi:thiol-disulfide isomerase/thioredoxin|uniref:TlpA family protein disulfide reductase n=1 Tax=Thermomonospora sp. CIF 1 TaxID=1916083 RepID=UPI000A992D45|nr:TlpA disulfide reductase family protein [Thermomonospora sp. CIF 1]PKK12180.1 MAG: oxidoreductase [Thermomonospora sp. CIF 1]